MKTVKSIFPACKKDGIHRCCAGYVGVERGVKTNYACACNCHRISMKTTKEAQAQ